MSLVLLHLPGLDSADAEALVRDVLIHWATTVGGPDATRWDWNAEDVVQPYVDRQWPPRRVAGQPRNEAGVTAIERRDHRERLARRLRAVARRTIRGVAFDPQFSEPRD